MFDGVQEEALRRYACYKKLRLLLTDPGQLPAASAKLELLGLPPAKVRANSMEWVLHEGHELGGILTGMQDLNDQGIAEYYLEKPTLEEVIRNAFG